MKIGIIAATSGLLLLGLALFWRLFERDAPPAGGLSAASVKITATADEAESATTNSVIKQVLSGDASALAVSPGSIDAYLQSKTSNAMSLLVAFQIEKNDEHLLTAAAKFPQDPRVQLAVLM